MHTEQGRGNTPDIEIDSSRREPLVSVVIPVYNAAASLDETLCSVRTQTYRNLEILIIDDGSTDESMDIAARHSAADPRIRIIRQRNGGVAAARNTGIGAAQSELIAPIDADDLWAPDKIRLQVSAMLEGGAAVTMVYSWHARIDAASRILTYGHASAPSGDVLRAMCRRNLVGNGSAALMRKSAIQAAGGYDATLKERGGQGCEDYKLYLSLAVQGKVLVVPAFLTGYRVLANSMSGDVKQMCRSNDLVLEEFSRAHPELTKDLHAGRVAFMRWMVFRALGERKLGAAISLFSVLFRQDYWQAVVLAFSIPFRASTVVLRRFGGIAQVKSGKRPSAATFPIGVIPA